MILCCVRASSFSLRVLFGSYQSRRVLAGRRFLIGMPLYVSEIVHGCVYHLCGMRIWDS